MTHTPRSKRKVRRPRSLKWPYIKIGEYPWGEIGFQIENSIICVADAKKFHEWLGRAIEWAEQKEKRK